MQSFGVVCFALVASRFLQVSHQQQDVIYDDDDESGLGDNFQPSVKASCVGGSMTIRVDTLTPFNGIVHGSNRSEPGCSVQGRGGRKTYLRLDLTKEAGSQGSCGVKYNQQSEERRVAIAVRAHPTIELLEDRVYIVSCGRAGFQNSRNEVSVVQLRVALPADPSRVINTVLEGERYLLKAEVLDHDAAFGFLVKRCFAFDETDTSLQLVDSRGCKDDSLISEFKYDMEAGTAEATLYKMFRLPHSNRTYFQCDVAICKGRCTMPKCSNERKASLEVDGELKALDEREEVQDPFERPEDDAVTTSTSVFIAQPGSLESASAVYCAGSGLGAADTSWLSWLAIVFGILFGVMLLINIFLCSAMTCSCTKSEIVEKEPSVYDDYSLYESQFGYANGGAKTHSDLDYGSEYQDVAYGRNHVGGAASDAGTQYSKAYHHNQR